MAAVLSAAIWTSIYPSTAGLWQQLFYYEVGCQPLVEQNYLLTAQSSSTSIFWNIRPITFNNKPVYIYLHKSSSHNNL